MRPFRLILIFTAVLLAGFLLVTALLPNEYQVDRKVLVRAQPESVMPFLVELEKWHWWNPMRSMDPAMRVEDGPLASGVGSYYDWFSGMLGNGRMEIVEILPQRSVTYRFSFDGDRDNPVYSSLQLTRSDGQTEVLWSYRGKVGGRFFSRWLSLVAESSLGPTFDRGLQKLKALAETFEQMHGMAEAS